MVMEEKISYEAEETIHLGNFTGKSIKDIKTDSPKVKVKESIAFFSLLQKLL